MSTVDLTDNEWGQVMQLLANKCLWAEANPLLMKIGDQLRAQAMVQAAPNIAHSNPGNGQEVRHE